MIDKQIMIDGVDVSELTNEQLACMNRYEVASLFIKTIEQLKRKEQECEELKKNVEHWKMEHKEAKSKAEWTYDLVKKRLVQQLDQLKAEKDELKEYIKHLHNLCGNETDKQYKYKQTLIEIKEIAEIDFNHTCWETYARQLEQILQKINEALDK